MSSASYKNGHVVKNMTGGKGKKENLVHMRGGGGKQGGLVSYLSFFFIFHFGMQASQGCGTKGVVAGGACRAAFPCYSSSSSSSSYNSNSNCFTSRQTMRR